MSISRTIRHTLRPRTQHPALTRVSRPLTPSRYWPWARLTVQCLEDRTVPATFVIDTLSDAVATDGKTSIREALQTLNTGVVAGDAIFAGSIGSSDSIDLTGLAGILSVTSANGSQLDYSKVLPLTITGPGSSVLSIQNTAAASSSSRVFGIFAFGTTVAIENLKISGGNISSGNGAGLTTSAELTLNNVEISGNTNAGSGNGGGIAVGSAGVSITLNNCIVSGNQCKGTGGGIRLTTNGGLTLNDTLISNNSSGTQGGGVLFFSGGTLNMTGSTVSGNKSNTLSAGTGGGGISVNNVLSTIRNSTISGNSTNSAGFASPGGGISSNGGNSILIQNSTIALNDAGTSSGGGIKRNGSAAIEFHSTIVSNNTDGGFGPDVSGAIYLSDHSLLGNKLGTTIAIDYGTTVVADPLLDVLANYGGPTPTHNLKSGSPAINAGAETSPTLTFDQRGTGFPRTEHIATDIGALETTAGAAPDAVATAPVLTVAGGTTYTVTVTYADFVGSKLIDGSTLSTGDITVSGPNGFFATPTIAPGPYGDAQSLTVAYEFNAPDNAVVGKWDSTDNGIYRVNIVAGQVSDKDTVTPLSVGARDAGGFAVLIPIVYTVDEVSDVNNGTGKLSIREAIVQANADGVPSAIVFDATEFSGTKTITMTAAALLITEGVTITGPAGGLIVDAGAVSRVINIDVTNAKDAVSISNLTATNGKVTGTAFDDTSDGAGIRNVDAALTLTNVTVSNCVTNKLGGGIGLTNGAASLDLIDSHVSGNKALSTTTSYTANGGGINVRYNSPVSILRSTVSSNVAGATGGGIYLAALGSGISTFTMLDSSVWGNLANQDKTAVAVGGGGLTLRQATVLIQNSTISGNSARFSGGGIVFVANVNGAIKNSTVATNTANFSGGGLQSRDNATNVITLESTIVANNTGVDSGPDILGKVTANNSLIGNTADATISGANNQLNKAASLAPLAFYGGPTKTHGLVLGSAALDAGGNPDLLVNDQRGAGFPRQVGSAVDIGAFEGILEIPTGVATPFGPIITAGTAPNTIEVVYTDSTGINPASMNKGNIEIMDPNSLPLTITGVVFTPTGTGGKAVYTFTPPGGAWDVGDNGKYNVSLLANQVFDNDVPTNKSAVAATIGVFEVVVPITYLVDEVSDVVDSFMGVGQLSLREALNSANGDGAPSKILFDPAVFNSTKTITMTGGQFAISEGVTITGPAAGLILDAAANSRVVNINLTTLGDQVNLSNLTLTNGKSPDYGGGIGDQNAGLALTNVTVSNCTAALDGGGIFYVPNFRALTLTDCLVINNQAITAPTANGGGIRTFNTGAASLILTRTTVSGNQANRKGGGIYATIGNLVTIVDSTISSNTSLATSGSGGGGLFLHGASTGGGTAVIRNSTISGNTSLGSGEGGGGVLIYSRDNPIAIVNSTIAHNSAGGLGGGIGFAYGAFSKGSTAVTLSSTIVANNTSNLGGNDISNVQYSLAAVDAQHSLIGDTAGSVITGSNNQLDVNPLLSPLALNGGPTKTHALLPGSPAINTGSNTIPLAFDQRGNARVVGAAADIGAYEVQPPAKVSAIVINGGDAQRSRVTKVQVNFNQHVGFTGSAAAAFTLTRVNDSATVTLNAVVDDSGSGTAVTLTFTGGPVEFGSLADGRYALHALAAGFNAEGLDGDGNGTGGDDFFFDEPASPAALDLTKIFRLYGDGDGNGTVNQTDFIAFRNAFNGGPSSIFDFEGDGNVTQSDFTEFRNRFNLTP